jgi:hypothetical protein
MRLRAMRCLLRRSLEVSNASLALALLASIAAIRIRVRSCGESPGPTPPGGFRRLVLRPLHIVPFGKRAGAKLSLKTCRAVKPGSDGRVSQHLTSRQMASLAPSAWCAPLSIGQPRQFKSCPRRGETLQLGEKLFPRIVTESDECRPRLIQTFAARGARAKP